MTIVEFFDDEAIDNAMGALLLRPQRAVFLYTGKRNNAFFDALDKILKTRGIKTQLIAEEIDIATLSSVQRKIESVVDRFPDCDFDIAGGCDLMLVAMGEAAKKYSLPMHTVDVRRQMVTAVNSVKRYTVYNVSLTAEELIELHSGRVGQDSREPETYLWRRNEAVEEDIEKVWNICKQDPGAWNSAIGTMRGYRADKKNILAMIWSKLKRDNLVRKDASVVKYKNEVVKYLLSKQGTALEMYTYITAKAAMFFDDGQSGIIIDWKGRREVENEIDVLLTRGAVGYFISCKNGMTDSSELYKLSTVAGRFGGKYAKKILVLTSFTPDVSFMERAQELGIKVIKDVKHLSKKDFQRRMITD